MGEEERQEPLGAINGWLADKDRQLVDARTEGEAHWQAGIPPADGAHPKATVVVNEVADLFTRYRADSLDGLEKEARLRDRLYKEEESKVKVNLEFRKDEDPERDELTDDRSKKLQEARSKLERINRERAKPGGLRLRWPYIGLMAFFAVAELRVNRTAFELFWPPATSMVVALIVGVGLLIGAHYAGLWARQCSHASQWKERRSYLAGIAGVFLFQGVVVLLLAACRHAYILYRRTVESGVSVDEAAGQVQAGALAQQAFSFDFGVEGWMLLAINVFMLAIGTVLSAVRHDPVREHEHSWLDWHKLDRKQQKRLKEWGESRTRRKMAELDAALGEARDSLDAEQRRLQAKAREAAGRVVEILMAYEYANAGSPPRPRPSSFITTSDDRLREVEQDAYSRFVGDARAPSAEADR